MGSQTSIDVVRDTLSATGQSRAVPTFPTVTTWRHPDHGVRKGDVTSMTMRSAASKDEAAHSTRMLKLLNHPNILHYVSETAWNGKQCSLVGLPAVVPLCRPLGGEAATPPSAVSTCRRNSNTQQQSKNWNTFLDSVSFSELLFSLGGIISAAAMCQGNEDISEELLAQLERYISHSSSSTSPVLAASQPTGSSRKVVFEQLSLQHVGAVPSLDVSGKSHTSAISAATCGCLEALAAHPSCCSSVHCGRWVITDMAKTIVHSHQLTYRDIRKVAVNQPTEDEKKKMRMVGSVVVPPSSCRAIALLLLQVLEASVAHPARRNDLFQRLRWSELFADDLLRICNGAGSQQQQQAPLQTAEEEAREEGGGSETKNSSRLQLNELRVRMDTNAVGTDVLKEIDRCLIQVCQLLKSSSFRRDPKISEVHVHSKVFGQDVRPAAGFATTPEKVVTSAVHQDSTPTPQSATEEQSEEVLQKEVTPAPVDAVGAPCQEEEADESTGTGTPPTATLSYRERVIRVYQHYAPAKLSHVDRTLVRYEGREEQLLADLVKKYGAEPKGDPFPSAGEEEKDREVPHRAESPEQEAEEVEPSGEEEEGEPPGCVEQGDVADSASEEVKEADSQSQSQEEKEEEEEKEERVPEAEGGEETQSQPRSDGEDPSMAAGPLAEEEEGQQNSVPDGEEHQHVSTAEEECGGGQLEEEGQEVPQTVPVYGVEEGAHPSDDEEPVVEGEEEGDGDNPEPTVRGEEREIAAATETGTPRREEEEEAEDEQQREQEEQKQQEESHADAVPAAPLPLPASPPLPLAAPVEPSRVVEEVEFEDPDVASTRDEFDRALEAIGRRLLQWCDTVRQYNHLLKKQSPEYAGTQQGEKDGTQEETQSAAATQSESKCGSEGARIMTMVQDVDEERVGLYLKRLSWVFDVLRWLKHAAFDSLPPGGAKPPNPQFPPNLEHLVELLHNHADDPLCVILQEATHLHHFTDEASWSSGSGSPNSGSEYLRSPLQSPRSPRGNPLVAGALGPAFLHSCCRGGPATGGKSSSAVLGMFPWLREHRTIRRNDAGNELSDGRPMDSAVVERQTEGTSTDDIKKDEEKNTAAGTVASSLNVSALNLDGLKRKGPEEPTVSLTHLAPTTSQQRLSEAYEIIVRQLERIVKMEADGMNTEKNSPVPGPVSWYLLERRVLPWLLQPWHLVQRGSGSLFFFIFNHLFRHASSFDDGAKAGLLRQHILRFVSDCLCRVNTDVRYGILRYLPFVFQQFSWRRDLRSPVRGTPLPVRPLLVPFLLNIYSFAMFHYCHRYLLPLTAMHHRRHGSAAGAGTAAGEMLGSEAAAAHLAAPFSNFDTIDETFLEELNRATLFVAAHLKSLKSFAMEFLIPCCSAPQRGRRSSNAAAATGEAVPAATVGVSEQFLGVGEFPDHVAATIHAQEHHHVYPFLATGVPPLTVLSDILLPQLAMFASAVVDACTAVSASGLSSGAAGADPLHSMASGALSKLLTALVGFVFSLWSNLPAERQVHASKSLTGVGSALVHILAHCSYYGSTESREVTLNTIYGHIVAGPLSSAGISAEDHSPAANTPPAASLFSEHDISYIFVPMFVPLTGEKEHVIRRPACLIVGHLLTLLKQHQHAVKRSLAKDSKSSTDSCADVPGLRDEPSSILLGRLSSLSSHASDEPSAGLRYSFDAERICPKAVLRQYNAKLSAPLWQSWYKPATPSSFSPNEEGSAEIDLALAQSFAQWWQKTLALAVPWLAWQKVNKVEEGSLHHMPLSVPIGGQHQAVALMFEAQPMSLTGALWTANLVAAVGAECGDMAEHHGSNLKGEAVQVIGGTAAPNQPNTLLAMALHHKNITAILPQPYC